MSIVELNKAGDMLVCSGQKIIKDYINKYNNEELKKINKIKEEKIIFKNINLKKILRPNYWDNNLKRMLANENQLLNDKFINDVLENRIQLWNTCNKQINHVNIYNIKQYARDKLYEKNKL